MLNLDTHIVIFALSGELTKKENELLAADSWSISDIVLWEITKLVELGRIKVNLKSTDFRDFVSQIKIWPISLEVCEKIGLLDFKSDSADEIISATSLAYGCKLVTRDRKILKSKIIPLA